jgi:hypothetical protein
MPGGSVNWGQGQGKGKQDDPFAWLGDLGNWFMNSPFLPELGLNQSLSQMLQPSPTAGTQTQQTATGGTNPNLQSLYQQILGAAGAAGSASGAPAGYYTPDGVWINDNSPQDAYYRMVDAIWTRIYGQHPPFSMVQTFHDLGVENTSQLDTIMKQMPSHISNPDGSKMPIGQYDVIKGTAESFSDKYFGRPIPDSLIQQWAKSGITDPESIELWFLNHPAKDIPKDVYGKIFDAAAGQVKQLWNDLPHPDTVANIHQNLASTGTTGTTYLP